MLELRHTSTWASSTSAASSTSTTCVCVGQAHIRLRAARHKPYIHCVRDSASGMTRYEHTRAQTCTCGTDDVIHRRCQTPGEPQVLTYDIHCVKGAVFGPATLLSLTFGASDRRTIQGTSNEQRCVRCARDLAQPSCPTHTARCAILRRHYLWCECHHQVLATRHSRCCHADHPSSA